MTAFSVVTAVKPGGEALLDQAYRSLCGQTLDDWEWLVQLDGPQVDVPRELRDDSRVHVGASGRSFGAAVARNMALSKACGEWVVSLDHDDLLVPQALATLSGALRESPEAHGAAFAAWVYDGQQLLEREPALIKEGLAEPGEIADLYLSRGGHTGIHYNAVCLSHRNLLELGGWPGVASNEDSQLLTTFSSRWPILYLHTPLMVWCHHAQQTHRQAWFDDHRRDARRLAARRLAALAGERYLIEPCARAATTGMCPSDKSLADIGLGWIRTS